LIWATASADYEILERFHEEGESAKTTDRSQLQALLKYCRTHKGKVHFVVVYNLTRFAREKYDHVALRAHLKSLGISLRSATEPIDDTSTGKLMEGVLAAFAQFDNDVRSDRTRAGIRADARGDQRRKGLTIGPHCDYEELRAANAAQIETAWPLQRSLSVMRERDALLDSLHAIGGVERGKRGDELIDKRGLGSQKHCRRGRHLAALERKEVPLLDRRD
jgi:DNA invertase Pin-like site-specific DNA recombinase